MVQVSKCRSRGAFTLVELLVVIGIIALLISVLLPALNKAREASRQVKCMSNMQQIAKATIMFASENNGTMPLASGGSPAERNGTGNWTNMSGITKDKVQSTPEWIAWRRGIDPVTGTPITDIFDTNITYSALARYLGGKFTDTWGDYVGANRVSDKLEDVFRCPSDNLEARPKAHPDKGAYRYSYSYNQMWSINQSGPGKNIRGEEFDPVTNSLTNRNPTVTSKFSGKIGSIKRASDKLLLVCEDEQTLDDNLFTANTDNYVAGTTIGAVAARHENRRKNANSANSGMNAGVGVQDARGNVAFVDGHVEFTSRKEALSMKHTGQNRSDHPAFAAMRRP